jgi:branched-chain amino acid aminotransferase
MSLVPFDDRDGWIWLDGQFVPWREAKVHVLTHGLHYASSVFEGERMYGGEIYKLTAHTERLFQSAEILDFEIPYTVSEIDEACKATCAKNGLTDAYVRPIAWRGSEMIGVSAQQTKIHVAIAVWDWPSYFEPEQKKPRASAWPGPSTSALAEDRPPAAKAAGLYMICTISKHAAEKDGYSDAMMLDYRGYVAEATGANVFFVKDGVLHTPTPDCFLNGITRQSVMKLAKQRARGGRAPHQAGRDGGLHRMLHRRHRRRGHPGGRGRRVPLHPRPDLAELMDDYARLVRRELVPA